MPNTHRSQLLSANAAAGMTAHLNSLLSVPTVFHPSTMIYFDLVVKYLKPLMLVIGLEVTAFDLNPRKATLTCLH